MHSTASAKLQVLLLTTTVPTYPSHKQNCSAGNLFLLKNYKLSKSSLGNYSAQPLFSRPLTALPTYGTRLVVLRLGLLLAFKEGLSNRLIKKYSFTISYLQWGLRLLTRLKFNKIILIFKILTGQMPLRLSTISSIKIKEGLSTSPCRELTYSVQA